MHLVILYIVCHMYVVYNVLVYKVVYYAMYNVLVYNVVYM